MSEILASPITSLDTFRDLLTAYRLPPVILSALELDLFTALGKRARMVAPLAAELKVSERGLEILCRNLAMCGLLTKKGPRYRNSPFAATALNARDRAYRGAYLELLKTDGTMILVGAPDKPTPLGAFPLLLHRRRLVGSLIGGIKETQEMLNFCAKHRFGADVEILNIQQVNEAYERLVRGDVRYRFVIDLASLK